MGKVTGFMEFERLGERYEVPQERLRHWREFTQALSAEEAGRQGARCMDCGIPFCNNGCPVNNVIPDFNDWVYRGQWQRAIEALHSTNNFPEFTGRLCPAPCETACTLGIGAEPVGIKSIERAIIERAFAEGWVTPGKPAHITGKRVAIVGSGPAGLAAAQQLARAGHAVTVFEQDEAIGGLLRFGIPDFKLDKALIDRRLEQMRAEGVVFRTGVHVGNALPQEVAPGVKRELMQPQQLLGEFDAVLLSGGAQTPRDLSVPGRELSGVHFAMEYLTQRNRANAGAAATAGQIDARGKAVVVIGGGDTGSDCVGSANRQGAKSVTQIELLEKPPLQENKPLVWPDWPLRLRTSSSHEEGCQRDWAIVTKRFEGERGTLQRLIARRVSWAGGKMSEQGEEFTLNADLVFLAMGFLGPRRSVLDAFGVAADARGNAQAGVQEKGGYATNTPKVFAAGDMRRGQSLIVWAIREGRQAARAIDQFLMGASLLPR